MNIVKNIDEQIEFMTKGGGAGVTRAQEMSEAALNAALAGIGRFDQNGVVTQVTPQWEKFMKFFAKDAKELNRLCGKEEAFNKSQWGLLCLAYMSGDSACTSQTTGTTGPKRSMSLEILADRKMLENLDAEGVDLAKFKKP